MSKIEIVENNLQFEDVIKYRKFKKGTIYDRMTHHKTPAVSIAVIDDFKLQWMKGYGTCDLNSPKSVDENTLFQAGSISKTVFSYAIMRLVQEGTLSLDEDVNCYLKRWKIPSNDGWIPKVTLRQILSHTAGFTTHGFTGYKRQEELPDIIELLNGKRPSTTNDEAVFVDTIPGLQYRYSGGGYTVAQLVVEDVTGKKFSDVLSEYVLRPLKMVNSTYLHPLPQHKELNVASGYLWHYIPVEGGWYNFPHLAAGGLWTSSADLAKFCLELMLAVKGKSEFLSQNAALEITKSYSDNNYGLGIRIKVSNKNKWLYHGGCMWGYEAKMAICSEEGKGVVIMMNSLHEQLIDEIERAVASAYNWVDYLPTSKYLLKDVENDKEAFSGKYQNDKGFEFVISVKGNCICLKYGIQNPISLYQYDNDKFLSKSMNVEIEFLRNSVYEIVGMKVIQNDKSIVTSKLS